MQQAHLETDALWSPEPQGHNGPLSPNPPKAEREIEASAGGRVEMRLRAAAVRLSFLILLDLNLPRKDGQEVLAEIKADQSLAVILVVVLTCSTSEQDLLRAQ
jgi:CheY-like chemotaxis protein